MPDPATPPQTIGELIAKRVADGSASTAASSVAVQSNAAAAAAANVVVADDAQIASDLKQLNQDIIIDNGDGTYTGYISDSSALGYRTEVFGGASTPLPTPAPVVPPVVNPPAPVDPNAPPATS